MGLGLDTLRFFAEKTSMKSSPRKAKFTRLVLNIARRIPKILPPRLKYLSTSYPLNYGADEEKLERASLFYDPENCLSLKGINLVIEVSTEELERVQQWHRQDKLNWVDERHIDAIYSREYLSSPRENIVGYVRFDGKAGFQCIDRVECDAKLFHGCLISLVHLPSGSLYLNFFFWGGPVETSFVQGVSASHLNPTVEFQGYNLFRRSNLVTWHFSRSGLAEQLVKKGLESLKLEALRNLSALLKKMRIDLHDGRYIFKAWDFVNNDANLRYPSDVVGKTLSGESGKEFVSVTHEPPDFYGVQGQALYLDMNESGQDDYDLLSVSSKKFSSFKDSHELDQFKSRGNQVFDSLMVMCLVGHIYANVKQKLKLLETEIGFQNKVSRISGRQTNLFEIVESLSKVRDELGELKRYKSWMCPKPYVVLFEGRIEGLDKFVEKILKRAEREYKFTNDMIGIKVVRSNNRFSWVLASFALVQIALAYLAVDWSKAPDASGFIGAARGWFSSAYSYVIARFDSIWTWISQTL